MFINGEIEMKSFSPAIIEEMKEESGEQEDLSDKLETSFRIEVTLANESEQETLYNELTGRGWTCKILTL